MDLEEQLKGALARKAAPDGFAERVTARAAAGSGTIICATVGCGGGGSGEVVGGGVAYRHHQGEIAKEQVMTAMKITAVKLHRIQTHVLEVRQ